MILALADPGGTRIPLSVQILSHYPVIPRDRDWERWAQGQGTIVFYCARLGPCPCAQCV